MKITIRKPLGYSQIGRKDQQEDAVWPSFADVSANNPCIVLCDGVGGSEHGEVASQTTSKVIGEYLTQAIKEKHTVNETDMQNAVTLAYDELEKIDTETPKDGSVSMATTLTCVCLYGDGVMAAHMGDSRIYHVRPGQGLLYQSADHSLVNALLQAGELTVEEAKTFPRKNVITKAIQPHAQKRFKAEVHLLTDIQSGDYLFLCCDGVLEQLSNERLVEVLSMHCSDEDKIKLLEAESTDRTKDNYTAYLIPIDTVEGVSSIVVEDEVSVDIVEVENEQPTTLEIKSQKSDVQEEVRSFSQPVAEQKKKFPLLRILIGLGLLLLVLLYIMSKNPGIFTFFDSKEPEQGEAFKSMFDTVKTVTDTLEIN